MVPPGQSWVAFFIGGHPGGAGGLGDLVFFLKWLTLGEPWLTIAEWWLSVVGIISKVAERLITVQPCIFLQHRLLIPDTDGLAGVVIIDGQPFV